MPVPVSQTSNQQGMVHITDQHNSVLQSEGPFERAARLKSERDAAGIAEESTAPKQTTASQVVQPVHTPKLQGEALVDVKGLNFSYPGLGGWH